MKFYLAVLIALSSLLLLNVQNTSTYETREILPQTGFWNYLPVFGIWARIVHYLAVDSDGLGNQVKTLDSYFKHKYTPEKYVDLVQRIVNKAPKVIIAFRVLKIKDNLREVQDPITGRTLGEAIDIIHDIGSDEDTVNQIASRLNLVEPDNISMGASATNFDLKTTLKNTILENPAIIGDVLKDPQVVNFITSSILQYLASDKVVHGIESMQQLITIIEIAHPNMFQEGQNSLSDLRDEKSGMTFIKTLETLMNIIENPQFPKELAKLLNTETLTYLHQKTQDVVSKVIEEKTKVEKNQQRDISSNFDKPTLIKQSDEKMLQDAEDEGPKITAKDFVGILNMLNIKLDEKTAERILQSSQNNELDDKAHQFLTELTQTDDLTPEKVSQFIGEKGVTVDAKSVKDAVNTITSLPADMLAGTLQGMGLKMSEARVAEMKKTVEELKKKYEKNHPPPHQVQPLRSSFHRNESEEDKENSEMI